MKQLLSAIALLTLVACSNAEADHSDNGQCLDEIKHCNSIANAADNADAKALRDEGSNFWAQGKKSECEAKYKAAIELVE